MKKITMMILMCVTSAVGATSAYSSLGSGPVYAKKNKHLNK